MNYLITVCCEDILSSRERLFYPSFFFLKIIYKQLKMYFFYTVPHPFPQTDHRQERLQKERVKGQILKQKKIHFSSSTQMGIFSKIILNRFFLSFFFCKILFL